ncbi:MAG: spondin domain-containing protein [Planctomycetales bacterium]|nr:spondin domain-containing protein [Planctomycetales bacterium]
MSGVIGRNAFSVCLLFVQVGSVTLAQDSTTYRVTFDSIWSAATHPVDWPGGVAHYSGLIGGTHNATATFWELGGIATSGIEAMAEFGSKVGLENEVKAAIAAGTAGSVISGGGLGTTPGSVSVEFTATQEFPLASIVSMIAPSPDWFVGTNGLDLRSGDGWAGKIVHELDPYDAGTDSGLTFRSLNADTQPAEVIHSLSDVFPFQNTGPLGTFTFLRLIDGDFNETGTLDAADIDALGAAIRNGLSDARFDLNNDDAVTAADRNVLVNELLNTYAGDSNLDGEFNSSDLTKIFQASQYEDGISGNSSWETGDWNGDEEFETSDLVYAFAEGGYERGRRAAVGVPEPSSFVTALLAMLLLLVRARRS